MLREASSMLSVGCREVPLTDPVQDARIPLWLLYPSHAAAKPTRFGPYAIDLAEGAPPQGERLPLVVVSHGNGGSPWSYRDLAAHLARAGFVVALFEHPGNSRSDNRLAGTVENLANRPRHVRLVIDAAFADEAIGPRLSPSVAVIGHSIGAYTALAVAGGRPSAPAHQSPDGVPRPVPVTRDPRVRALVLFAPAALWYVEDGALADVDVPVLLRSGENDADAPAFHGDIVLRGLGPRASVDARTVPNAGHFSFQSPFPASMCRPDFPPSQDPEGFDRAAYLPVLCGEVTAFLRAHL